MNNILLKKISKAVVKEIQALKEASDVEVEKVIQASIPTIIDNSEEIVKKIQAKDPSTRAQVGNLVRILKQLQTGADPADEIIVKNYSDEIKEPTQFKKNLKSIVDAYQSIFDNKPESDAESKEDMYDPSDEDREMLRSAYNTFKEEFYQVRKMVQQGQLIQLLINQLSKIQKEETEDSYQKVDEILNEEEKQRVKKELENVKTDFRSFYQELLSTRDLLQKAGKEAKAGKLNFNLVKKEFLQQLQKIQDDILEIYSDLVNLSPPKAEVEEIPESQQFLEQEEEKDDRLSRAKKIQAVYNEITKSIGPIVAVLSKGEPFPESRMLPAVATALEKLNKIVDFFPSVKAFSGQTGSFEELKEKYTNMIRDLGYLNDNFQRLVKDESVSSTAINNLYLGLKRFSKEMEDTFGVESKIIDKPKPTDSDAKPIDPESNDTIEPSDDAQPTPDKPEIELKSPTDIRTFFNTNIMKYPQFKTRFPQEDIDEDHFNALMLLYALSEYEQPSLQEQEQDSLSPAVKKTEMFLNFDRDKVEDDLVRIRTLNKQVFDTILDFYQKVKRTDANNFDKIIRKRLSNNPLSVTARRDNLIKNFNFVEPPKDVKSKQQPDRNTIKRRKQKRKARRQRPTGPRIGGVTEDKLTKSLKPLIEKILKEQ